METKNKKTLFDKFLSGIEILGNKVPHPLILFLYFTIITVILSHILYLLNVNVTFKSIDIATMQPIDTTVYVESLLSTEGIRFMVTEFVNNFGNLHALGIVLVAMAGVGVAEGTGFISAAMRKLLLGASKSAVTFTVVFLGVISSIASDAGYVVLIPLAAAIFHGMGRHPLAGLAAGFAGVSAGFGANLFVTPSDAMLMSITNEAIALIDPTYSINVMANYYFSVASTILITIVGGLVTQKIIEPRLGEYKGNAKVETSGALTQDENRGLKYAFISLIFFAIIVALITLPYGSALRNPETGEIIGDSPFMDGMLTIVVFGFLIPGITYGYAAKTVESSKDIINHLIKAMQTMGALLAILIVVGQFIAYLNYSRIGTVLAVNGSHFLESIGFTGIYLLIAFALLTGLSNFLLGGMITKWAIFAPIFIPMFMQMGISPAMTQVAYRIGDSTTNIINPVLSFFALILVFAQKYDEDTGIGTIIATMIPYTIWFTITWIILMILWYVIGLPLGPGSYIYL